MTPSGHRFWSNVVAVAYKEATALRHDRPLIVAVMVQPVILLCIYGTVLSTKPANVPWAVLDESQTAVSRQLVAEVEATGYFLAPRPVAGYDLGRSLLTEGRILALLVIPSSFRRDLEHGRPQVQLLLDGSDPLSAARVGAAVGQVAAAFRAPGATPAPHAADRRPLDVRQRFWFNATLSDRNFLLAAFAGMLLTNICLSATSLGLVAEREGGTYEQMLALPTTPLEIVLGKLLPYVALSYGMMFFAVSAAGVIFGLWPQGSWLSLIIVTLPFVLASLAIGVLVSVLSHTSAQAVFITVFFIMPSFVLSGVMLPYQFMPRGVREIGALFPLRWYQIALRRIIDRGAGLTDIAVPGLMLCASFAALLAIIRWRMKPRLD